MEQTIVQHYGIISTFLPFDNELRSPGLVKGWKNHPYDFKQFVAGGGTGADLANLEC